MFLDGSLYIYYFITVFSFTALIQQVTVSLYTLHVSLLLFLDHYHTEATPASVKHLYHLFLFSIWLISYLFLTLTVILYSLNSFSKFFSWKCNSYLRFHFFSTQTSRSPWQRHLNFYSCPLPIYSLASPHKL